MTHQFLADGGTRPSERIADGLLRDAELIGDLLLLKIFSEVQLHDLLLTARQDAYVVEDSPGHYHALVKAREILVVNASRFHAGELCFHVRADLQAGPS